MFSRCFGRNSQRLREHDSSREASSRSNSKDYDIWRSMCKEADKKTKISTNCYKLNKFIDIFDSLVYCNHKDGKIVGDNYNKCNNAIKQINNAIKKIDQEKLSNLQNNYNELIKAIHGFYELIEECPKEDLTSILYVNNEFKKLVEQTKDLVIEVTSHESEVKHDSNAATTEELDHSQKEPRSLDRKECLELFQSFSPSDEQARDCPLNHQQQQLVQNISDSQRLNLYIDLRPKQSQESNADHAGKPSYQQLNLYLGLNRQQRQRFVNKYLNPQHQRAIYLALNELPQRFTDPDPNDLRQKLTYPAFKDHYIQQRQEFVQDLNDQSLLNLYQKLEPKQQQDIIKDLNDKQRLDLYKELYKQYRELHQQPNRETPQELPKLDEQRRNVRKSLKVQQRLKFFGQQFGQQLKHMWESCKPVCLQDKKYSPFPDSPIEW